MSFFINPYRFAASSPTTNYVISPTSLVAYYPFTNSGTTDASGNGNNLTWSGTSAWTYSNMGTSMPTDYGLGARFGGSSMLTSPYNADFYGDNKKLSVFFWMSRNRTAISLGDVSMSQAGYGLAGGWRIITRQVVHDILVDVSGTTASIANVTPERGTAHVGFTYDGSNIRVYKNGQQVGSNVACTSTIVGSDNLFIGRQAGATPSWYNGDIDDYVLFKRVLSGSEIAALYSSATPFIYTTATTYSDSDSDVTAWANSMSATPSTYYQQNLSVYVSKLKAAGIWTKLDRMWIHAAEDREQAGKCIKTLSTITEVNGPTFTAFSGHSGFDSASLKYLDTNYIPNVNNTAYTQNSASIGCYNLLGTGAASTSFIGSRDGITFCIVGKLGTTNATFVLNQSNVTMSLASTNTNGRGLWAASRTASNVICGYKQGGLYNSGTTASNGVPGQSVYIGCYNSNGSPLQFSTTQMVAMSFIGGGLTTVEIDQLNMAFEIFLSTIATKNTAS